jgi:hypothetical protein
MPYKLTRPPRDLAKVKCVKKTKDKNGEVHFDLKVMFNYVSIQFIDAKSLYTLLCMIDFTVSANMDLFSLSLIEQSCTSRVGQAEFLLCRWLQRCPSFSTYRNNLANLFQVSNLAGCVQTQQQGARVRIHSVEWHHFPHNVYSQTEPSSTPLIPKK